MNKRAQIFVTGVASAAGFLCACAGTAPPPPRAPLEPLPALAAVVPDAADHAARDIARALLRDDADAVAAHIARLQKNARANAAHAQLLPYALDAATALSHTREARARARETLLRRRDLPMTLRARLETEAADDPLKLAQKRLRDGRLRRYGGFANTLARGFGARLENPVLLPLRVTRVLLRIALREHHNLELSTAERQALEHWKRFVAKNPESTEAVALLERIEAQQARWFETKREQSVRAARVALESGRAELAAHLAARALRYAPNDPEATRLLTRAQTQREAERQAAARTLEAAPDALSQQALQFAMSAVGDTAQHKQANIENTTRQAQQNDARVSNTEHEVSSATRDEAQQNAVHISNATRDDIKTKNLTRAEAALLRALWLPRTTPAELAQAARTLHDAAPDGARADEARFVLAFADAEAGREVESWKTLEALARERGRRPPQHKKTTHASASNAAADGAHASRNSAADGARSSSSNFISGGAHASASNFAPPNMARHAWALVGSLDANPYGGFRAARAAERGKRARWLAFGPLAAGARDHDLPRALEWLVEVPSTPAIALGLPQRLVQFPFLPPLSRAPGVLARRYLARAPHGAHADEVRAWLIAHEQQRENYVGAWQLARAHAGMDAEALEALRARAAQAAAAAARAERRRGARLALLRDVAQNFPDTDGGRDAGLRLRAELKDWSPQRIRISRAFLKEQRAVAGPRGLALRAQFLDGVLANGELHADGVALLGERTIELAFVAASGDESDAPLLLRERISKERLARTVVQLEESAQHLIRTDRDVRPEHDTDRDTYLERARLGAVERVDARATALSSYRYRSARERFGLVRGRESLLPVELVLQGSFDDFGLGAFPRLRLPRHTPDSVLYE